MIIDIICKYILDIIIQLYKLAIKAVLTEYCDTNSGKSITFPFTFRSVNQIFTYELKAMVYRIKLIFEKYKVKNISQLQEVKSKKKQTSLKNYGVEYPTQNKMIKEQIDSKKAYREWYLQERESAKLLYPLIKDE